MAVETSFTSLTDDLVANILHRVVASSLRHLGSIRLTCKRFSELTEDEHFYRRMSLDHLPKDYQWKTHASQVYGILENCRRNKNLDALFTKAVKDYFGGYDEEEAFEILTKTSRMGHAESSYALAIIMLFRGSESKKNGMQLLAAMTETSTQRRDVKNLRSRLKEMVRGTWVRNKTVLNHNGLKCCSLHGKRARGWDDEEEIDREHGKRFCVGCSCDVELQALIEALPFRNVLWG